MAETVDATAAGTDVPDLQAPPPWRRLVSRFGPPRDYRLVRFVMLRLLGLVYLFAFLSLLYQVLPLLGSDGLTPAARYLDAAHRSGVGFWKLPTIFWLDCSDATLVWSARLGVVLSLLVLFGLADAPILLVLWLLYGSFVHVGQVWYAYGWEIELLEVGFLAIFLAPPLDPRPFGARPPPLVVIVLYRWLVFRIMLGAGLIKWRHDDCWRSLTCLDHHFETQPVPNPISPLLHHLPHWVHAAGVAYNHVVELLLPLFVFGPRRLRLIAGAGMLLFQLILISSGNLSFLNWLTIIPIVACFDDDLLRKLAWRKLRGWLAARRRLAQPSRGQRIAAGVLAAVIALLSLDPIANLASSHQHMNASYEPFALCNSYGAFGSVGKQRYELVFEGTRDELGPDARWREYEFPCKPGDPNRRPCILGPWHWRLDWQVWFAAMAPPPRTPWVAYTAWNNLWIYRFIDALLVADPGIRSLLAHDPFGDTPPRYLRIVRYHYRFADSGGAWWVREPAGMWLGPVARGDPRLRAALERQGFEPR